MAEELFREQAGSAASAKESPRSSSEREEGGQLARDRSDRWADIYEDMPVRWGSSLITCLIQVWNYKDNGKDFNISFSNLKICNLQIFLQFPQ